MELADIPAYSGSAYCEINGNVPAFDDDELVTDAFENYSDLDSLGRCGVAYANICKEIMPTEERGVIGMVKPSGWHTVKYNDRIDGNYLYNRCHLIGYQLAGENANEKNLITGTRYLNVTGMLPFENEVADYVESTGNHVLYRVTPVYDGDNLVASGVQMEAESVEDKGAGVSFNVYVYNVQPGVLIDYATGGSEADPGYVVPGKNTSSEISGEDGDQAAEAGTSEETQNTGSEADDTSEAQTEAANEDTYIVNTNTGKFHKPSCRSVKQMKESNKSERTTTRDELISEGYEPCKNCNP
ncbi:DNA/RNA non-specific endonuclease [Coprococcus eutactus]|uniref:DNA/RNA non-specific endonuclease n=1 Tax=Coprococcus eutactus TaxID=33043 RepID=UPI0038CDC7B2